MAHVQVRTLLGVVLEPVEHRDVGFSGAPDRVSRNGFGLPRQRPGLLDRDRVRVAELAVEVRDADHHLDQVPAFGGPVVRPAHQLSHQALALVLDVRGDLLDLARRDVETGQRHRLVHQRGGGDDLLAVGGDPDPLAARVRVCHQQAGVDAVAGVHARDDELLDLVHVFGA